jgi:hypothetical protein
MKTLSDLYGEVKTFAESHPLVNEFVLVSSEEDLETREFEFRSLVLIPSRSNISREANRPIYEITFSVVVFDRVDRKEDLSIILSSEENIFVIGQLQDYLLQELGDSDVEFNDIDIVNAAGADYNVTSAVCEFTVALPRSPYIKTIAQ